jgi:hypothetical protein
MAGEPTKPASRARIWLPAARDVTAGLGPEAGVIGASRFAL